MLATTQVWVRIPRTMLPALADLKGRYDAPSRSAVIVRALELYLAEHTEWRPSTTAGLP